MHALNGNSMEKRTTDEIKEQHNRFDSVSDDSEKNTNSGCVVEVTNLWFQWKELLKIAQLYRLLRFSPAEVPKMKTKLQRLNLSKDPRLIDMGAVALCGFI